MSAEIIRILKVWRCCGLFPRTFESGVGPNERHKVTRIGPASFTLIGMSSLFFIIRMVISFINLEKNVIEKQYYNGVAFISDQGWYIQWNICDYVFCVAIILNNNKIVKSLRALLALIEHFGMHKNVSSIDSQQLLCVLLVVLYIIQLGSSVERIKLTSIHLTCSIINNFSTITFLFLIASFYKNVAIMCKNVISKSGRLFGEREQSSESKPIFKVAINLEKFPVVNSNRTFNLESQSEIEQEQPVDLLILDALKLLKALNYCLRLFTDAVSYAIIVNLMNASCGITGALYFSIRALPKVIIDVLLAIISFLLNLIFYVNIGMQVNRQVRINCIF